MVVFPVEMKNTMKSTGTHPINIETLATVEVVWENGTSFLPEINRELQRAGNRIFAAGLLFRTYLVGALEGNEEFWRRTFGDPNAHTPITGMSLAFVTVPRKPHLLTVWCGEVPLLRMTSPHFPALEACRVFLHQQAEVQGFQTHPDERTDRGWFTAFSPLP